MTIPRDILLQVAGLRGSDSTGKLVAEQRGKLSAKQVKRAEAWGCHRRPWSSSRFEAHGNDKHTLEGTLSTKKGTKIPHGIPHAN